MNIFPGPLKKEMNHAVGNQTDPLDEAVDRALEYIVKSSTPELAAATSKTVLVAAINAEIAKARIEAYKRGVEVATKALPPSEVLARYFHDMYEDLAPEHGYETRKDTKTFSQAENQALMTHTASLVLRWLEGRIEKDAELELPHEI